MKNRNKARKLQDKVIAKIQRLNPDWPINKPIFEGGPTIDQLKQMVYIEWIYMFKNILG